MTWQEKYKEACEWLENDDRNFAVCLESACMLREVLEEILALNLLVAVPDGEPKQACNLCPDEMFTCDHPGVWKILNWSRLYIYNIHTGEDTGLTTSALVQPVRLVRLEDMEGEKC